MPEGVHDGARDRRRAEYAVLREKELQDGLHGVSPLLPRRRARRDVLHPLRVVVNAGPACRLPGPDCWCTESFKKQFLFRNDSFPKLIFFSFLPLRSVSSFV